jgi:CrcB protein
MNAYLWVGLGGFLGSVARHAVAVALPASAAGRFPAATFAVNCLGCLLIGAVAGLAARTTLPDSLRLFLVPGLLGGFTTFSAFGLESLGLLRRGELGIALMYVLGSVLVGVFAVWLGLRLAGPAQG